MGSRGDMGGGYRIRNPLFIPSPLPKNKFGLAFIFVSPERSLYQKSTFFLREIGLLSLRKMLKEIIFSTLLPPFLKGHLDENRGSIGLIKKV